MAVPVIRWSACSCSFTFTAMADGGVQRHAFPAAAGTNLARTGQEWKWRGIPFRGSVSGWGGLRAETDGASWLAWMSIWSGRYVPSSENPPGQPVTLECPERPGGGVGSAAEFVRQFCFRRQLGPRRVFAAPDPPREHGVNVRVGLRVLSRIIQANHTGSVTPQPCRTPCAPSGTFARGRASGWFTCG